MRDRTKSVLFILTGAIFVHLACISADGSTPPANAQQNCDCPPGPPGPKGDPGPPGPGGSVQVETRRQACDPTINAAIFSFPNVPAEKLTGITVVRERFPSAALPNGYKYGITDEKVYIKDGEIFVECDCTNTDCTDKQDSFITVTRLVF